MKMILSVMILSKFFGCPVASARDAAALPRQIFGGYKIWAFIR
jgi:hypothetical protein